MRRSVPIFLALALAMQAGSFEKRRIKIATAERIPFVSGGTIEIRDSFGEVIVEGWDQADVEIEIRKGTNKKYAAREEAKAWEHLDQIRIEAFQPAEDRLVISTSFPSRNLFTRPLKGKTNADITYRLKVPHNVNLRVKHDVGVVEAADLCGNIEVTNRIGEITLRLREDDDYHVDARSRIGDVDSQFGPPSERRLLVGAQLRRPGHDRAHLVYVRVGVGEINIQKLPARARVI